MKGNFTEEQWEVILEKKAEDNIREMNGRIEGIAMAENGVSWKVFKDANKSIVGIGKHQIHMRKDFVFNPKTCVNIHMPMLSAEDLEKLIQLIEEATSKMSASDMWKLKRMFIKDFEWYQATGFNSIIKFVNNYAMAFEDILFWSMLGHMGDITEQILEESNTPGHEIFVSAFGTNAEADEYTKVAEEICGKDFCVKFTNIYFDAVEHSSTLLS